MKNNKKVHVDTYESFYPVFLVVANEYATAKDINKEFCWEDGTDVLDSNLTGDLGCALRLMRRSDKRYCVLVKIHENKFNSKKDKYDYNLFTAVHEAGHVILDTYDFIGDDICSNAVRQEPFCYYLEWIFKCIYTTMTKK